MPFLVHITDSHPTLPHDPLPYSRSPSPLSGSSTPKPSYVNSTSLPFDSSCTRVNSPAYFTANVKSSQPAHTSASITSLASPSASENIKSIQFNSPKQFFPTTATLSTSSNILNTTSPCQSAEFSLQPNTPLRGPVSNLASTEISSFLQNRALVAEAAKRAQISLLSRDLDSIDL